MRLCYINGLRGIAIIGVIWHHFTFGLLAMAPPIVFLGVTLQPVPILMDLWKGVDLFFVLSGFVLYVPFVTNERRMAVRRDVEQFYLRRARRLIPPFLLVFLIVYCLQHKYPISNARFYIELIGVPTLAFQFTNLGFVPPSFGPLWSVGIEILFGAIFPALILLRSRMTWRWMLAGGLALSLAAQFSGDFFVWRSLQQGLPHHLINFLIGMLACEVTLRPGAYIRLNALAAAASGFFPVGMIVALLLLDVRDASVLHIVGNLLFSMSAGGLLIALGAGEVKGLRRMLEARWLQVVGCMCYSLYLWHLPIMFGLFPGFPNIGWQEFVPYAPLYVVLTLAVSALSYRYIEFPKATLRSLFLLHPSDTARSVNVLVANNSGSMAETAVSAEVSTVIHSGFRLP